jgi:N-acyl-D-aspartate/D-glutamate deacylase
MTDLVIRGGLVVDGTGAAPFIGDVAIEDGKITETGKVTGRARREIEAGGLIVTPGFVDPHTHFDGQATWDSRLAPSSQHGVTTVVTGNCGVGFAPARTDRHEWLIGLLEGVEDIPGTALAEGLPWDWESFPEYLDSLDRVPRTIDVGVQIPHAALRVYVMGERGADPHESPTAAELDGMARRVGEGLDAGAIGFSTSRTENHRTKAGAPLGTLRAEAAELLAIAAVMRDRGKGVVQLISDCYQSDDAAFARQELDLISSIARTSGRPLSYTVLQAHNVPGRFRELLSHIRDLRAEGLNVKGQMAPRPVGILLGLEASVNPFSRCASYAEVAGLALAERVAALRQAERRRRILAEHAGLMAAAQESGVMTFVERFESMYLLADPVDYDLSATPSLTELARAQGADPAAWVYDAMLDHDGTQLLYAPVLNFADRNFGAIQEMITSPETLFGLSDAGAHCGAICDASMTTSYLTTWVRDRKGAEAIPLERVVHQLTRRPAEHLGWLDRGLLSPGHLADVNIIDLDGLGCRPPRIVHDLPAGGRRLVQDATGYRHTIKKGVPTLEDGQLTGELPAGLLRGTRPAPAR